jgi:outer membrane lipoprotein-sorting protein
MMRNQSAFLAAAILGLGVMSTSFPSVAQTVPVPRAAPQAKTGQVPPPPSLLAQQRTPAPIPSAPAANNAPASKLPMIGNKDAGGGFDAKQRALADRISAYLSGIRTMVGDFVQVGPDGSKTQGQVYLQKPGRVRFEYADPSPIELIADGSSVVVRDRKLATQDLYAIGQTPLKFLLKPQLDLNRDTKVLQASAQGDSASVTLEDKNTLGGVSRITLTFDAKSFVLKNWRIRDPQGNDTFVALSNIDTASRPDPGKFRINYERDAAGN